MQSLADICKSILVILSFLCNQLALLMFKVFKYGNVQISCRLRQDYIRIVTVKTQLQHHQLNSYVTDVSIILITIWEIFQWYFWGIFFPFFPFFSKTLSNDLLNYLYSYNVNLGIELQRSPRASWTWMSGNQRSFRALLPASWFVLCPTHIVYKCSPAM